MDNFSRFPLRFLHKVTAKAATKKKKADEITYDLESGDGDKQFVAKIGDKEVGSVTFEEIYSTGEDDYRFSPYEGEKFIEKVLEYENLVEIRNLAVEKEFREKGIATKLMEQVMHYIKEHMSGMPIYMNASPYGADRDMSLSTLVNFYKKFGFKVLKSYPEHRNAFMWKEK